MPAEGRGGAMSKRVVTEAQREALENLADGREAIRHRPFYEKDCFVVASEDVVARLAKKGFVRIEEIGASAFARITEAGQRIVAQ